MDSAPPQSEVPSEEAKPARERSRSRERDDPAPYKGSTDRYGAPGSNPGAGYGGAPGSNSGAGYGGAPGAVTGYGGGYGGAPSGGGGGGGSDMWACRFYQMVHISLFSL